MSMSEGARRVLRHKVLELRSEYRKQRGQWKEKQRDADDYKHICVELRGEIAELQADCGDPIEIDPQEQPGEFPT